MRRILLAATVMLMVGGIMAPAAHAEPTVSHHLLTESAGAGGLTSAPTAPTAAAKAPLRTGIVTISGKAKVGKRLTAKPGAWTKGTTFTYQWLANGKKIPKATKRVYRLKVGQAGKKLSVTVTGAKAGYAKASVRSATTATVRKAAPPRGVIREFKNCTELNKAYPHGVGKKGAVDQTSSGPRATPFYVSNEMYAANSKSDRDKDGVACEA